MKKTSSVLFYSKKSTEDPSNLSTFQIIFMFSLHINEHHLIHRIVLRDHVMHDEIERFVNRHRVLIR